MADGGLKSMRAFFPAEVALAQLYQALMHQRHSQDHQIPNKL
jgi:hypothetical protein